MKIPITRETADDLEALRPITDDIIRRFGEQAVVALLPSPVLPDILTADQGDEWWR